MYHHVKKLMYTVNIGEPDVRFGNMLLEQFGGANGELAAAMQYTIQGWNCVDDLGRRDLLLDIGTEELSHLEVVGALIRMHLKPLKTNREAAEADPLVKISQSIAKWRQAFPDLVVITVSDRDGRWHLPLVERPRETVIALLAE